MRAIVVLVGELATQMFRPYTSAANCHGRARKGCLYDPRDRFRRIGDPFVTPRDPRRDPHRDPPVTLSRRLFWPSGAPFVTLILTLILTHVVTLAVSPGEPFVTLF